MVIDCQIEIQLPIVLRQAGLTAAMPVRVFDSGFGWWRREGRQTGDGQQKLVCTIEEVRVDVEGTVGDGQEDGGVARVIDGDVG